MRIGHYMAGIWDQGGIAKYLQRVSRAQREAGHCITFFDTLPTYTEYNIPEERPVVVSAQDLVRQAGERGLDVLHLHTAVDPLPRADNLRMVRSVHEHRPYCPSGGRYLRRQQTPCNRVYSIAGCLGGHYLDRCGPRHPGRMLAGFKATRADRRTLPGLTVIAISDYVRTQMIRNGYDGSRIHVVRNPAPSPRPFQDPPRDAIPRFLFLGRLVPNKGLGWLLQSMVEVSCPIALDVAGDGPWRAETEAYAAQLGLRDSVTFHGWIEDDAIDALAANARAVVFPPIWHEPAGLACMDGSARGRAVIASESGGLPEYAINGENALVVPINDTNALARALTRLAEDWSFAQQLGRTGHAMAAGPFSLAQHLQHLEQIYRELAR